MTMLTNQCPWRMQVYHITQETPDVRTISPICRDYYPYRAGQYALVSMQNSAGMLRAYAISSTPNASECITLTVRQIDDGVNSWWLARDVRHGDYLWLSDAMGEFICDGKAGDRFLLLATGCGVMPIISMRRWLTKNRPQAGVRVTYNMRTPQGVIFADEWHNYPITLVAENNITGGFIAGRLTHELLIRVPDLASRTMATCGPIPYMDWAEQEVRAFGATRFFKEKFFTPITEAAISGLKFTKLQSAREFYAPVGTTLLEALGNNNVPVVAACHAGVCGCCKTKVTSGEYTVNNTMTPIDAEIVEGYAPACSCHPQGDLVLTWSSDARWCSFHRAI